MSPEACVATILFAFDCDNVNNFIFSRIRRIRNQIKNSLENSMKNNNNKNNNYNSNNTASFCRFKIYLGFQSAELAQKQSCLSITLTKSSVALLWACPSVSCRKRTKPGTDKGSSRRGWPATATAIYALVNDTISDE